MKLFHTADWHLGKLVQGVYMTEDQRYVLEQFIQAVAEEKPDAVIIAGDLYDRAVPPTEAVQLLNELLQRIVIDYHIPVLAIAGNHDSPSRLDFGSHMMKSVGFHVVGDLVDAFEPVVLHDEYGAVHFHLIPYAEPGKVRHILQDGRITNHNQAMEAMINRMQEKMDAQARHVFVGHAFVTPDGEKRENTSTTERTLSIGGAEHVQASHFECFHYVALGHLHQAHHVSHEFIRYAGSPLKFSISEEHHNKGYYVVELDANGLKHVQKRSLHPRHDMRTVQAKIEDIERQPISEDYVFVRLLDEAPVLSPMERVRAVYPNAMHVERALNLLVQNSDSETGRLKKRIHMDEQSLFKAFYKEVKGFEAEESTQQLFQDALQELQNKAGERS